MSAAPASDQPLRRTPLYAQLERGLRASIAAGRLRPGDQLPTVRQLAVDLRVNANTVARVYADLERAGVLETRRGVGSFISATGPAEARPAQERSHRRGTRNGMPPLRTGPGIGPRVDSATRHAWRVIVKDP